LAGVTSPFKIGLQLSSQYSTSSRYTYVSQIKTLRSAYHNGSIWHMVIMNYSDLCVIFKQLVTMFTLHQCCLTTIFTQA